MEPPAAGGPAEEDPAPPAWVLAQASQEARRQSVQEAELRAGGAPGPPGPGPASLPASPPEEPAAAAPRRGPPGGGKDDAVPLRVSDKLARTRVLAEYRCEVGGSADLSGDTGAVGRLLRRALPDGREALEVDLKGVVYRTEVVPTATVMVATVTAAEGRIDAVVSNVLRLHADAGRALSADAAAPGPSSRAARPALPAVPGTPAGGAAKGGRQPKAKPKAKGKVKPSEVWESDNTSEGDEEEEEGSEEEEEGSEEGASSASSDDWKPAGKGQRAAAAAGRGKRPARGAAGRAGKRRKPAGRAEVVDLDDSEDDPSE